MARASKVWLVYREPNHELVAAFTVKREALAWIDKKQWDYSLSLSVIPDGGRSEEAYVGSWHK